ncbi:MAG: hypothetical protein IJT83_12665 [Victivallales bacterium]|nr:hypothetical protein [Victivallales bacterium]
MSIITIIGAGMMGSAMSWPATDNGHTVRLVGSNLNDSVIESIKKTGVHPALKCRLPENVFPFYFSEIREAIPDTELFVCGVSSFGLEWFATEVLPLLPQDAHLMVLTKGLLSNHDGYLHTTLHYFNEYRPDLNISAIGGPCICSELIGRHLTMVSCCAAELSTAQHLKALLNTDYYHLQPTTDVIGVECAVAIKNTYAVGVALALGMAEREAGITDARPSTWQTGADTSNFTPYYNHQAALFAQSCLEMRRLVRLFGGNEDVVSGLAGAGDLYVTSQGGRNGRLGVLLGRGLTMEQIQAALGDITLESVPITQRVAEAVRIRAKHGEVSLKQFPLLLHLDALISQQPSTIDWESFG